MAKDDQCTPEVVYGIERVNRVSHCGKEMT
jgi:hypothetical protein